MSLDQATKFVKRQGVTRDAFLGGRLTVTQPEKGFRSGLDSVLLGAAIRPGTGDLLDLGAGAGTAALVGLSQNTQLTALLAEADPEMTDLAERNVVENGFAGRARVLRLDFIAVSAAPATAGLPTAQFSSVIANPPFFDAGSGTAPSRARAEARHMQAGQLDLWVKTAADSAAPGGEVIFIYRAAGLPELLAAFSLRFGALRLLPFCPRPGEAANRILIRGIKGSRAPLTLLPGRSLHGAGGGAFQPEFDVIFRGQARLDW